MRLPWVSREMLESVTAVANKCLDDERRLYDGLSERYSDLLTKYHALKLQGAVAVEPHAPIERKAVDEVTQRINILSAGKPGLRSAMLRQVQSDRLLGGLDDMEILQRIEAGVTTDDGVMA